MVVSFFGLGELDGIKLWTDWYQPGDIVIGAELPDDHPKKRKFRAHYTPERQTAAWSQLIQLGKEKGVLVVPYKGDILYSPYHLAEVFGCSVWDLSQHIGQLMLAADTCNMHDAYNIVNLWTEGEAFSSLRDRTLLESNVAIRRQGYGMNKTEHQASLICGANPAFIGWSEFPKRETNRGPERGLYSWCSRNLYSL